MNINDLILCLVLGVILVENLGLKILIIIIGVVCFWNRKLLKKNVKEILVDSGYVFCVTLLNYLVNINLNFLNFLYFVICGLILFYSKIKVKFEWYFSLYLFMIVIAGGIKLCGGL